MALSANISISDASPYVRYTASASQTTFTYPWPIFAAGDLKVYSGTTLQTEGSANHYTVTGVGVGDGGTVVFNTGLAVNTVVTIARDMPIARTTDLQTGAAIRARILNEEYDKLVAMMQQLERDITRSFRLPITDNLSLGSREVTPVSGEFLKWGGQGNITSVATDPSGTVGDASAVSVTNGFLDAGNVEAAFTEVLGTGITPGGTRTVASLETYLANNAVHNIKDYGAAVDGATNDTTAVQAAIDAAALTSGTVYFPPGQTNVTTLDLTAKNDIVLLGASAAMGRDDKSSVINGTNDALNVISFAGDYNADSTSKTRNVGIRDLEIKNGLNCIASTNNLGHLYVENVKCVSPMEAGVLAQGFAQQWFFRNINCSGGKYGLQFQHAMGTSGSAIGSASGNLLDKSVFNTVLVDGQSLRGIQLHTHVANNVTFTDVTVNHSAQHGIDMTGGLSAVMFNGVNMERNGYLQAHTAETAVYDNVTSVGHDATYSCGGGDPSGVVFLNYHGSSGVGSDFMRYDINATNLTAVTIIAGSFDEPVFDPFAEVSVFNAFSVDLYGRHPRISGTKLRAVIPSGGNALATTLPSPKPLTLAIKAANATSNYFDIKGEGDLSKVFGNNGGTQTDCSFHVEGNHASNDGTFNVHGTTDPIFEGAAGDHTFRVYTTESVTATTAAAGNIIIGGDIELPLEETDTDSSGATYVGKLIVRLDDTNKSQRLEFDGKTGNLYLATASDAAEAVLELSQADTGYPLVKFTGTAGADTTSSVSSHGTSGATTDHIQISLNGVKAWIAVSTDDPSA